MSSIKQRGKIIITKIREERKITRKKKIMAREKVTAGDSLRNTTQGKYVCPQQRKQGIIPR
jgi:hypothetical protein